MTRLVDEPFRIVGATRPGPLLPAVERLRLILQELISEAAAG